MIPTPAPTLTVLVASYNYAPYLELLLGDLLGQSWTDFELVVVDDASTDDTPAVLDALEAQRDPRVHVIRRERNLGIAALIAEMPSLVRGSFLYAPNCDDRCDRAFLERTMKVFEDHPRVGLVHCQARTIGADGRMVGLELEQPHLHPSLREHLSRDYVYPGREEFQRMLEWGPYPHLTTAVVLRREALEAADWLPLLAYEWHLFMRVAVLYDIAYLSEPLVSKRRHGRNLTGGRLPEPRDARQLYQAIDQAVDWAAQHGLGEPGLRALGRRAISRAALNILAGLERAFPESESRRLARLALEMLRHDPQLWREPAAAATLRRVLVGRLLRGSRRMAIRSARRLGAR
jgi:hypothetical protein